MAVDYEKLGFRIKSLRGKRGYSQEAFASTILTSRNHLSQIEIGQKYPSLELLVEIANALEVSTDDLLGDSLTHSSAPFGTELHKLLLDCNQSEEEVLIDLVKYMKEVLFKLGI